LIVKTETPFEVRIPAIDISTFWGEGISTELLAGLLPVSRTEARTGQDEIIRQGELEINKFREAQLKKLGIRN